MKRKNRWMALGLAVAMLTGIMAGCGQQDTGGTPESQSVSEVESVEDVKSAESVEDIGETTEADPEAAAVDTSKRVDLVCYFVGDPPADIQKVEDKINEILLEKINATISFNFTTWTDTQSKYNMILSGGENCDIIFTAPWIQYYSLIEKQAFLNLNDYIDQYAPELREAIPQEFFDETEIDGALYTLPNTYREYTTGGIIYREDLREQYDLPVPDSLENAEAYMQGIKENVDGQEICTATCANDIVAMERDYLFGFETYDYRISYSNPTQLIDYVGSEQNVEDLKKVKEWADRGYWRKDAIAEDSTNAQVLFENGKTVIYENGVNFGKYVSLRESFAQKNPDWKIGFVSMADVNGMAYPAAAFHNGTAIPVNSSNPERAIMAISLLFTDEALNHLLMYGIEGEHYNVDENGYYTVAENNSSYGYEASDSWNFRNVDIMLQRESDQEQLELFEHLNDIAANTVTPYRNHEESFSGIVTNDQAWAAVQALKTEYITPLKYGMLDDIEGTLAKYLEEAEKVGYKDVREEFSNLWTDYCKSFE